MRMVTRTKVAGAALLAGTTLAIAPATAQSGRGDGTVVGNVYQTNDRGDLKITSWEANRFSADYSFERGRIEGVRNGNQIDGYWTQATNDRACDTPRGGSSHYGRMTFTFNARLDAFEGRWGYCDETPYATWQGTLTRRGAAVASATRKPSKAGAPPRAAASVAPAIPAQQAGQGPVYTYATIGFDKIRPQLVLDTTTAAVTGSYTATQSDAELDAIYRTGTYGITSGTIDGQFSGNTLSGYWYEKAYNAGLQGYCENERNGTHVYGRYVLTFSADRKSFSGLRSGCDGAPDPDEHRYLTWTGTLIGRQAAAPAMGASRPQRGASAATQANRAGARPANRITDGVARAAEDEVNTKAEDAVRKVTRGLLGRIF